MQALAHQIAAAATEAVHEDDLDVLVDRLAEEHDIDPVELWFAANEVIDE